MVLYCSCGRQVSGNGGKRHFELEGHKRLTYTAWAALTTHHTERR